MDNRSVVQPWPGCVSNIEGAAVMLREVIAFLSGLIMLAVILVGTAMLVGCNSDDTKYIECVLRDRTSNPCQ
jgi:hypothetical protein